MIVAALTKCWAVLVPILRRDGELRLSDEQAGLLMRHQRGHDRPGVGSGAGQDGASGRSHTKPGSLLKSQIPVRTWADWDEGVPGFVEIDLVGHDGGIASGQFCFTLTVTDIATG